MEEFLRPTEGAESDHPKIIQLAGKIAQNSENPHQAAHKLFQWARDEIKYSIYNPFHLPEHYRATQIIERGHGYCVQKAVVLCALARAAGIPARLVFADIINHMSAEHFMEVMGSNLFTYHCYNELWLGDRWVQVTPAFNRSICEEHGFPLVEFDGHQDAIFPAKNAEGKPFVEYVKYHGTFADVPLEPMLQAWVDYYGRDKVELWKHAYQPERS